MPVTQATAADYPVRHRFRVRYAEVDAQAVVFNAHYLTYFDTAINEAFRSHAIDWLAKVQDSGCDVQLVKSLVEYKAPLHFDEEIEVCARIGRLGSSSISWHLAIFGTKKEQNTDLRATGEIVWVYANLAEKRSQPLPAWLRNIVSALQD